ncbi:MAG: M12 family metallopeptidase, partial [Acidobacteriota bacterium]|nr:M12 family metallopeptidase [Acidobacteriota bacterium]
FWLEISILCLGCFSTAAAQTAPEMRTGVYNGLPITYQVVDGLAIIEGDIILGPSTRKSDNRVDAAFTSLAPRLWTNNTVPYTIDADIPNQARITGAVKYYNENTPLKFRERTNEANYVRFLRTTIGNGACSSVIGMNGGEQLIRTDDLCGMSTLIHEMGHTIGFFHEQERKDRNRYVTVLPENIDKTKLGNFTIGGLTEQDIAGYEYASLMHYSPFEFSRTTDPVIQTVPAGIPFAEVTVLSPGDLDTLGRMYGQPPASVTVTSNPPGLQLMVDGAPITTPQAFSWTSGSTHMVDVPGPQSTATARYVFARWSDGGEQSHTVTASPESVTLYTANFIRQIQILGTASPAGAGTVAIDTRSQNGYYTPLTRVTLSAVPSAGNYFLRWASVNGASCPVSAPSPNPAAILTRNSNVSCVAVFAQTPVNTITSDPVGRPVTVDGTSSPTPANFSWTPGSSHTIATSSPRSTSASTVRYVFNDWSDGGAAAHGITAANGQTITARFTTQYPLALPAPTASMGSVIADPPSPDGFYDAGTTVQVTANPASGFVLQRWTADLSGTVNPQTLVMDEQKAVGALFNRPANLPAFTPASAASFQISPLSPGEIVTLFGTGLGPSALAGAQLDAAGRVATTVAETRVLFDGVPAPIVYVSANQTSVIVPYAVAGKASTVVTVEYQGKRSTGVIGPVVAAVPALFTSNSSGTGLAAVLNQDGSFNSVSNPAARGSVIVLFGTGEGQTAPGGTDGTITGAPPPQPLVPVSLRIGGKPADILYAGEAPQLVSGVLQVNATVPNDAPPGNASVYLVVGDA